MNVPRRQRVRAVVLGLVASMVLGSGAGASIALFTDSEQVQATMSTSSTFGGTTYYLHNDPTPPTGNTSSQPNLRMNTTAPTAATLFNYDTDRDSFAGRLILRGGSGAGETDLARHQNWLGPTAGLLGQSISGPVTVEFWSAMEGFTPGMAGEVRVFLRDVDSVTGIALEIANATVSAADWQAGHDSWVKRSATMNVNALLLVGHQLEVKLVVGPGAADDMLFAYDTTVHRSRVRLL